jgi:hypothetical protein
MKILHLSSVLNPTLLGKRVHIQLKGGDVCEIHDSVYTPE